MSCHPSLMLSAVRNARTLRLWAIVAVVGVAASTSLAAGSSAASRSSLVYTTREFLPGMRVALPGANWTVHHDLPGLFSVLASRGSGHGTEIFFWLDPIATAPHGVILRKVGRTPAALIAWFRQDRNFVVSAPVTRRIAHGLAATSIDLNVAATAPREDPGCPTPCLTYFVFANADPYGTGHGEPVRLFFATIHAGKRAHTFAVAVDTPSAASFEAVIKPAGVILANVRLPASVSTG